MKKQRKFQISMLLLGYNIMIILKTLTSISYWYIFTMFLFAILPIIVRNKFKGKDEVGYVVTGMFIGTFVYHLIINL